MGPFSIACILLPHLIHFINEDLTMSSFHPFVFSLFPRSTPFLYIASKIIVEGEFAGGELKRISEVFSKRVNDYILDLLSSVTGKNGKQISVVRHNGIEEICHRWSRMHFRLRTWRSQTVKEMTMYGALTAVLSNI